jgi:hypothetical protein
MADLGSKVDTFDAVLHFHELQDIPDIFWCKYAAKNIYSTNFTIKSFGKNKR